VVARGLAIALDDLGAGAVDAALSGKSSR